MHKYRGDVKVRPDKGMAPRVSLAGRSVPGEACRDLPTDHEARCRQKQLTRCETGESQDDSALGGTYAEETEWEQVLSRQSRKAIAGVKDQLLFGRWCRSARGRANRLSSHFTLQRKCELADDELGHQRNTGSKGNRRRRRGCKKRVVRKEHGQQQAGSINKNCKSMTNCRQCDRSKATGTVWHKEPEQQRFKKNVKVRAEAQNVKAGDQVDHEKWNGLK